MHPRGICTSLVLLLWTFSKILYYMKCELRQIDTGIKSLFVLILTRDFFLFSEYFIHFNIF